MIASAAPVSVPYRWTSVMADPELERIIAELERRQALLERLPHELQRDHEKRDSSRVASDEQRAEQK